MEVDVEELAAGDPVEVARANALSKARAAAELRPGATILGVDTVVALDGEIFGKPASEAAARDDAETPLGAHARGRQRARAAASGQPSGCA